MNGRNKTLLLIVLAIGVAVLLLVRIRQYTSVFTPSETWRGRIAQLQTDLRQAQQEAEARAQVMGETKVLGQGFFSGDPDAAKNEITRQIEQLGKQSGIRFNRLDRPTVRELSPNVQAVDVRLYAVTDIGSVGKFLGAVDQHRPLLVWDTCLLRPDRLKDPRNVILSGAVRGYVLGPEAQKLLAGGAAKP